MANGEKVPEEPVCDPNIPIIDAHGVWIAATRWCAQLQFVTPTKINPEIGPQDRVVAQVNLDWPLAKALLGVLGQTIRGYEEAEGTISLPRSFLDPPK